MEGHTYRYFRGEPLYPFGYGLSYTTFACGEAKVKGKKIIIPVTNTGSREGTEVVQLYVRKPDDTAGPIKTLRAFRRVTVPAGQTVEVTIPLDKETFLWWSEKDQDMVPVHGNYELLYGSSSADSDLQKVTYKF